MFQSCAQPLKEQKRITAIGIHVENGVFQKYKTIRFSMKKGGNLTKVLTFRAAIVSNFGLRYVKMEQIFCSEVVQTLRT